MSDDKLHNEQEMLLAFESGLLSSELTEAKKARLSRAADESLKKDKRINIRIASRDLEALQRLALREGVPYQTLISSILHKYVSGQLAEPQPPKPGKKGPEVWRARATRYPD